MVSGGHDMNPIYLPSLAHRAEPTETIEFKQFLPDLPTLTPVQASVTVTHHRNYLMVTGQADTIITLTCDRCLQQYNHRLSIQPSEMIWLTDAELDPDHLPLDEELQLDELVETVPETGYFDGQTWIYEQLCLALPQRQLCDPNCGGIELDPSQLPVPLVDRRWAGLEALRGKLPDQADG